MAAFAIVIPVTWNTTYVTTMLWQKPKAGSEVRVWRLGLDAERGAFRMDIGVLDKTTPYDFGDHVDVGIVYGPYDGHYPILGDGVSITRSEFLQKTLGFQICCADFPERPGLNTPIGIYSITIPYWLAILLCFPLPLVWLWRIPHRRRAYHRAHGLCLHCGYDLRASTGKCPECGVPITAPRESKPLTPTVPPLE
jgi:hypothetical protein